MRQDHAAYNTRSLQLKCAGALVANTRGAVDGDSREAKRYLYPRTIDPM